MKTSTTEKPEGSNWKELGFQKGMWEKYAERKAAKIKEGKNNPKQGKMEEKNNTWMFSLKGFLEKEEKQHKHGFWKWKRENQQKTRASEGFWRSVFWRGCNVRKSQI